MRLWFGFAIIAMALFGCAAEEARVSPVSLEGVKLSDIMPSVREQPIPAISFLVTTFEMDVEQAQEVRACWDSLTRESIRFADENAFGKNGFFVVAGSGGQIAAVDGCFMQRQVQRFSRSNLVLNPGFEVSLGEIQVDVPERVDYYGIDEDQTTVSLGNGTLEWLLRAEIGSDFEGQVHAIFEPVFTPWAARQWAGVEGFARRITRRFETGRFALSLGPADFVLIAPNHTEIEQFTSFERLFFLQPDKPDRIRFFVVLCVGVGN